MDYRDAAVDRIHYLVSRADELLRLDMEDEADLLLEQAFDIATELRHGEGSYGLITVHN